MGVQVSVVIGGGNIFRGVSGAAAGMDRAQADYMGMLATVMNALAMQYALEKRGRADPRAIRHPDGQRLRAVYSPPRRAAHGKGQGGHFRRRHRQSVLHHRHRGRLARRGDEVRRAAEGHPGGRRLLRRSAQGAGATRYEELSYHDVLANDLQVMDAAAISLARENHLPIIVFNIHAPGAFAQVMRGEGKFTRYRWNRMSHDRYDARRRWTTADF